MTCGIRPRGRIPHSFIISVRFTASKWEHKWTEESAISWYRRCLSGRRGTTYPERWVPSELHWSTSAVFSWISPPGRRYSRKYSRCGPMKFRRHPSFRVRCTSSPRKTSTVSWYRRLFSSFMLPFRSSKTNRYDKGMRDSSARTDPARHCKIEPILQASLISWIVDWLISFRICSHLTNRLISQITKSVQRLTALLWKTC